MARTGLTPTYWSVSTRLTPWCIVQPRTSDEVSLTLTTLTSVGNGAGSWHIAVRGGGHNHWPAHADLYKALKGGASNFGIVTRFDLEAFPSADLYGGSRTITTDYTDRVINAVIAFANYNVSQARDTFTPTFIFNTQVSPNITIDASILNIDGSSNTTGLMGITRIPAVSEDLRMRSLVSLAQESTVSGTSRSIWLTLTFRAIPVVLHQTVAKWEEFVENMKGFVSTDDFQVQMNFQHLPTYYGTSRRGGNVLGLDSSLVESSVLWVNIVNVQTAEQEAIARLLTNTLRAELEDFAVAENANVPFRYLNYAEPSQDPLRGYGAQNVEFIRNVAKAYDPRDVFQSRIIGGFKISRTT
ncbi:hypothetical protein K4K58_003464 [Colletotrichum sp. SAR11_239]|nr:hypothetical protein K4K58_003464 [Colletotrichum sp. SAR11_239]